MFTSGGRAIELAAAAHHHKHKRDQPKPHLFYLIDKLFQLMARHHRLVNPNKSMGIVCEIYCYVLNV